jgi:hypothetical protein
MIVLVMVAVPCVLLVALTARTEQRVDLPVFSRMHPEQQLHSTAKPGPAKPTTEPRRQGQLNHQQNQTLQMPSQDSVILNNPDPNWRKTKPPQAERSSNERAGEVLREIASLQSISSLQRAKARAAVSGNTQQLEKATAAAEAAAAAPTARAATAKASAGRAAAAARAAATAAHNKRRNEDRQRAARLQSLAAQRIARLQQLARLERDQKQQTAKAAADRAANSEL